jgi:hypothetical protein
MPHGSGSDGDSIGIRITVENRGETPLKLATVTAIAFLDDKRGWGGSDRIVSEHCPNAKQRG